MVVDENGVVVMLIGDLVKGFSDLVMKICLVVGFWNYWSKWVFLFEII